MENRRRQIFNAHAAAFGGHIIRPKDIILEAPSASALTVVGGRSVGRIPATRFEDFFSIESATTFAEGLFDDREQFLARTNHKLDEQALTATSRSRTEVNGLVVGRKPRLSIRQIRGGLTATTPLGGGQPAVRVDDDVIIEGITVDNYRLIVELRPEMFQRLDTHGKLVVAASDPKFATADADSVFLRTAVDGQPAPPRTGRLIESQDGTIYATIVKSIRWDGTPFPESRIDQNIVVIPDFGRVYFGELLISSDSRRLSMVRMTLGSEMGGDVCVADVEDSIIWGY